MGFFETSFAITNSIIFNGRRWIVFNAARRVTTYFARHRVPLPRMESRGGGFWPKGVEKPAENA